MNLSAGIAQQTTTITPHQPEKACYINHGMDAIDQSSDTASSNGASPITPYEQKSFTFSDYGNKTKSGGTLGGKMMEPSPNTDDAAFNIQSYTYQQPVQQKQDAQQPVAQPLENDVDTPSPNQSYMPEIATAGNSNGDSIIPKMPWDNSQDDHTAATADDTIENQDNILLIYGSDEKYDMDSIGNSSCSIACLDFPSPPSSTPSLVPKLTIQTDRQHTPETAETPDMESHLPTNHQQLNHRTEPEQQHESSSNQSPRSDNKFGSLSRFKEIFDIEGTDIEWDYNVKYCQQPPVSTSKSYSSPLAPLPEKSVSSFITSPISPTTSNNDSHFFLDKQQNRQQLLTQTDTLSLRSNTNANANKTIGGFITNIGRSASSSSSSTTSTARTKPDGPIRSLSSSSSSSSLRGLMRSFSTTATNHYRQQTPKMTPHMNEEDGLSRAAQAVAATTTNDNDKLYLCREEIINEPSKTDITNSLDGQRRKISQLFSTAIKKAPTRRHTTKVVNMQQQTPSPSSKKLLRRTVIYVNPEDDASQHDFYVDLLKQYQPQRPAPVPPSPIQRYRYDKTLPPVPSTVEPSSSSTQSSPRSSASSHLSSTSSSSNTNKPKLSYLEGLELREMEDGSMEWGIIKKEGHRQSFFSMAHLQQDEVENGQPSNLMDTTHSTMDDESEEHIEQQVLALMGLEPDHLEKQPLHRPPPIPRRSPRRKPSTLLPSTSSRNRSNNHNNKHQNKDDSLLQHATASATDEDDDEPSPSSSTMNVYYAPDMTLPSLLQLVSQTQQNNNNSINNVV